MNIELIVSLSVFLTAFPAVLQYWMIPASGYLSQYASRFGAQTDHYRIFLSVGFLNYHLEFEWTLYFPQFVWNKILATGSNFNKKDYACIFGI